MAYATKQSSAFDYNRAPATVPQQRKQPKLEALPENRQVRRAAPARVPYVKYALIAICIFAVLGFVLSSYVQLTELTAQNTTLRNSLSELQSNEKALQAKKEQQFNLAVVEQKAKELGMIKLDKSLIEYVELSNPERTTLATEKAAASGFVAGLVKSFDAVLEYLK